MKRTSTLVGCAALCRKESYQIVRDPSSILVAFMLPVILLFVMGYAINLDADHMRIGLLLEDPGLRRCASSRLCAPPGIRGASRDLPGELRDPHGPRASSAGLVIVRSDFTAKLKQGHGDAAIQVLTDGAEPNTASFVAAYVQGAFDTWQQGQAADQGRHPAPAVDLRLRAWFNPSNVSRNFLVPGSIAVVMTIIGALLTSLVVAREWERGTMEALLATPVTRAELLLSKIMPYYVLGMLAMVLCLVVSVLLMGCRSAAPWRPSSGSRRCSWAAPWAWACSCPRSCGASSTRPRPRSPRPSCRP